MKPGREMQTGGGFSANGVRSNGQNNFLLNGVDNNVNVIDFLNQTAYVIGPSVDAIGEMRVMTNGYNAEYGRGAGGVVNVTIKSGTNEIHGSVFEYLQNCGAERESLGKQPHGRHRRALSDRTNSVSPIGGPLIKNRTFWFADYQGTRITFRRRSSARPGHLELLHDSQSRVSPMATSPPLLGAQIGTDALGRPVLSGQIFDPNTQRT